MKPLRPALFFLVAFGCFDPLYELGAGDSWTVCCRQGAIDTCECLDESSCSFTLTACDQGRCVEVGTCQGGTGGGTGGTGGSGTGGTGGSGMGGSGTGGGSSFSDAGTVPDAGIEIDGGAVDAGQPDAGTIPDAGMPADAGMMSFVTYEPCCSSGHVTSCACRNGQCSAAAFKPCSMGRCVAPGATCP